MRTQELKQGVLLITQPGVGELVKLVEAVVGAARTIAEACRLDTDEGVCRHEVYKTLHGLLEPSAVVDQVGP